MLDAFIIEELRRREEQERVRSERPRLELPLYNDHREQSKPADDEDADGSAPERGVVVIDLQGHKIS